LTTINLSELVVGSGHRPPHQFRTQMRTIDADFQQFDCP
jgi:hypothetical protein